MLSLRELQSLVETVQMPHQQRKQIFIFWFAMRINDVFDFQNLLAVFDEGHQAESL